MIFFTLTSTQDSFSRNTGHLQHLAQQESFIVTNRNRRFSNDIYDILYILLSLTLNYSWLPSPHFLRQCLEEPKASPASAATAEEPKLNKALGETAVEAPPGLPPG